MQCNLTSKAEFIQQNLQSLREEERLLVLLGKCWKSQYTLNSSETHENHFRKPSPVSKIDDVDEAISVDAKRRTETGLQNHRALTLKKVQEQLKNLHEACEHISNDLTKNRSTIGSIITSNTLRCNTSRNNFWKTTVSFENTVKEAEEYNVKAVKELSIEGL